VTVLVWPEISDSGAPAAVPVRRFRAQIDLLADMEIQVVSLARAAEAPRAGVALTLDRGHRATYTIAYPILAQRGLTATVYVATGSVSSGRRTESGGAGMTWSMLRELSEAGWTVGSHGVSHRCLVELPDQELERELAESRTVLAESLGRSCRHFCAPGGAMDRRVLDPRSRPGGRLRHGRPQPASAA